MEEKKGSSMQFMGTYFDPDFIFKLSSASKWLGWVVLVVYLLDFVVALSVMILQITRGFWVYHGFYRLCHQYPDHPGTDLSGDLFIQLSCSVSQNY